MGTWHAVGPEDGIAEGALRGARIGQEFVALARVGGALVAFDDTCSHEECMLSDGVIDDACVVCPCHGAAFDVRTGEVRIGPATEPIRTYPVRIAGGVVEVELD